MPKINRLVSSAPDFQARLSALCALPDNAQTIAATQKIIAAVRQDGDDALLELTERFDGHRPSLASALEVSQKAINDSLAAISRPLRDALEESASRLRRYHHHQITTSWQYTDEYGNILGERVSPLARAAVYVPGGKASYPSSALMGLIPAKVAAVNEVILSTPAPLGKIPAVTLAAAAIGGADRVFMLSGAQAVAAFALGTKSVPRADVIVGPGNAYVAEAKRQFSRHGCF
ncbi:MAG: histidinol dehydrogenase [Candidatus Zeuxoniibacter abyssi]|nr:MAG: histidinol dehydrogenase [Candidatus Persebacteraceae bacterium AB1(2)]